MFFENWVLYTRLNPVEKDTVDRLKWIVIILLKGIVLIY